MLSKASKLHRMIQKQITPKGKKKSTRKTMKRRYNVRRGGRGGGGELGVPGEGGGSEGGGAGGGGGGRGGMTEAIKPKPLLGICFVTSTMP